MSRRARRPQPRPARTPAAPVGLVQVVVEAIARGELDDELAVLGAVIDQRVRLLATARSMTTLAQGRTGRKESPQTLDAGAATDKLRPRKRRFDRLHVR
jgi:hypothetical protein